MVEDQSGTATTRTTSKGPPWRNVAVALISLLLGSAIALYNLLLIERKWHVLIGNEPFLVTHHLALWEKPIYIVLFFAQILVLMLTATAFLRILARPLIERSIWLARLLAIAAPVSYFVVVTAQFKVLSYFKDGVDLVLLRTFGGGDTNAALVYGWQEFLQVLPVLLVLAIMGVVAGWFIKRYGKAVVVWLAARRFMRTAASGRSLIRLNAGILAAVLVVQAAFPSLHQALEFSMAHQFYELPVAYLTDFDFDGWGMLSRPRDSRPFDHSRHPYALEIPGNGIDENGIGGDLPRVSWDRAVRAWNPSRLERRNVLLVVIDSLRDDLLDAEVNGAPVMPVLKGLPGARVAMHSNAAFTVPSIVSLFNGTLGREPGISLIDRFKSMGYRTGVFSGQHEGFGSIAETTGMPRAGLFIHGPDFPRGRRMHISTSAAALGIPAPLVSDRFGEWLSKTPGRPFFAYLNWQELHFPYDYRGAPRLLMDHPIPRGRMTASNRSWILQTYWNAARSVDDALGGVIESLDRAGVRDDTVILVLGDHGEELFDSGYLGHGINLSYEQYATLCKLINSPWQPPATPVSVSDVGTLIHNALARSPRDALPISRETFCYVGAISQPSQLGLFTEQGLLKYNFRTGQWLRQSRAGEAFGAVPADLSLIHLWESYLIRAGAQP